MLKLIFRCLLGLSLLVAWARAEIAVVSDGTKTVRTGGAAPSQATGEITGTTIDLAVNEPVEFVAVSLRQADGTVVQNAVSDKSGRFSFEKVPAGEYTLVYNYVGTDAQTTPAFTMDARHLRHDFSGLNVTSRAVQLEIFEVKSKQQAFLNTIDRKTYNVGKDIQSTTGSASDLLQNLPSVQVDIDGKVSLRGSESVMILINGRTSTLMGKSRAEALQQLPADSIEKIEVITNPSAKYKPDGTAGIINISLKKKHAVGFSGTITTAYGNEDRANAGVTAGYHSGPWTLSGNLSGRHDVRLRRATEARTSIDPVTGVVTQVEKTTLDRARPFTRIARGGVEYSAGEHDKLGLTASYNHRDFQRRATDQNIFRNGAGTVTSEYDRTRYDPEFERSLEWGANWQHTFPGEDHELNVEFKSYRSDEIEDNQYANIYRTPVIPTTYENTLIKAGERGTETIIEYKRPLGDAAKLEVGYTRTSDRLDADLFAEALNLTTGQWAKDTVKSNRFIINSTNHAFYATYGQAFGKFGLLAGLRPELTTQQSRLVNTGQLIPNDYNRVYPTLHLAYHATDRHELQLNYSHRVRRPEIDDLNPFPDYQDPFNLRAGNPRLKPEDIHSIEAGYSFQPGDSSITSTLYHRYTYHGFTSFTRDIGGGVLLTTRENLAVNRATGFELTANTEVGKLLSLNFSSNTFFNTIDASDLGFTSTKSDVSWSAKLGATLHVSARTLFQFNTNYSSARLTPQGSRRPSYVANAGLRHDLWQKKVALVLTVSDVFNSLKETTVFDTPMLRGENMRRRSSRIVYLGFIYNFGQSAKKPKDDSLKFDNSL